MSMVIDFHVHQGAWGGVRNANDRPEGTLERLARFGGCSGVNVVALKPLKECVVGDPVGRHVAGSNGLQHAGLMSDEGSRNPLFVGGEVGEEGGVFEKGHVLFGIAAAVRCGDVRDQQGNP